MVVDERKEEVWSVWEFVVTGEDHNREGRRCWVARTVSLDGQKVEWKNRLIPESGVKLVHIGGVFEMYIKQNPVGGLSYKPETLGFLRTWPDWSDRCDWELTHASFLALEAKEELRQQEEKHSALQEQLDPICRMWAYAPRSERLAIEVTVLDIIRHGS